MSIQRRLTTNVPLSPWNVDDRTLDALPTVFRAKHWLIDEVFETRNCRQDGRKLVLSLGTVRHFVEKTIVDVSFTLFGNCFPKRIHHYRPVTLLSHTRDDIINAQIDQCELRLCPSKCWR